MAETLRYGFMGCQVSVPHLAQVANSLPGVTAVPSVNAVCMDQGQMAVSQTQPHKCTNPTNALTKGGSGYASNPTSANYCASGVYLQNLDCYETEILH